MKKLSFLAWLLACVLTAQAAALQTTAFGHLQQIARDANVALPGSADELIPVSGGDARLQMFAFRNGGFAILDSRGELLAYSLREQLTDSLSPAFGVWQKMAAGGINPDAQAVLSRRTVSAVAPLLQTKWSQSEPYNNDLAFNLGGGTYRFVTGCGATALSQVMKHFCYPASGRDSHSYTINYSNLGAVQFACNFAERTYDWAHMTDTYSSASTTAEKAAVAQLMRDAGYALNMSYNGNASSSVLFHQVAALRCFFGYSRHVRYYERSQRSAAKWAEMIYAELAAGRPILLGANDSIAGGGHAFVIDGYDADGLVHVNWGWGGAGDGYYQLALLNPVIYSDSFQYSVDQMMVIGIQPQTEQLLSKTVSVPAPGALRSLLTDEEMTSVQKLIVSGDLNSADVLTIRRMAGFDSLPNTFTDGVLTSLDLTDARFVAGGGCYYEQRTTRAGELPGGWFMTVDPAANIVANYGGLSEIKLPAAGLTSIGAQSLANQKAITRLEIPESVTSLGLQSLWNMDYHLRDLKVGAASPFATGNMAFASYINVNPFLECRLYVPDQSIAAYQESSQYWQYFEHILGHSAYVEESDNNDNGNDNDNPGDSGDSGDSGSGDSGSGDSGDSGSGDSGDSGNTDDPSSALSDTSVQKAEKCVIDGRVCIWRNGILYDLLGRPVQ